jgi:nitrogen fixation/metabolism regulation signal transduction histidine kinase
LIIARTKKGTIASVIFGVAIATALMPPLCTVGFGLSVALEEDFLVGIRFASGALYLFTINSIFIALATFITIKILKFPMLKYANSKRRRFISRVATGLAIIAMIPAIYTFVDVLRESNFNRDARKFFKKELAAIEVQNLEYLERNSVYKYIDQNTKILEINSYGLEDLDESTIAILENRMKDYPALENAKLFVNQDLDPQTDQLKYIEQLRIRDSIELVDKAGRIQLLEQQTQELNRYKKLEIPFNEVAEEARLNYSDIESFSFYNRLTTNFDKTDTIPVVVVNWSDKMKRKDFKEDSEKLEAWLKYKLKMENLVVSHQK